MGCSLAALSSSTTSASGRRARIGTVFFFFMPSRISESETIVSIGHNCSHRDHKGKREICGLVCPAFRRSMRMRRWFELHRQTNLLHLPKRRIPRTGRGQPPGHDRLGQRRNRATGRARRSQTTWHLAEHVSDLRIQVHWEGDGRLIRRLICARKIMQSRNESRQLRSASHVGFPILLENAINVPVVFDRRDDSQLESCLSIEKNVAKVE